MALPTTPVTCVPLAATAASGRVPLPPAASMSARPGGGPCSGAGARAACVPVWSVVARSGTTFVTSTSRNSHKAPAAIPMQMIRIHTNPEPFFCGFLPGRLEGISMMSFSSGIPSSCSLSLRVLRLGDAVPVPCSIVTPQCEAMPISPPVCRTRHTAHSSAVRTVCGVLMQWLAITRQTGQNVCT